MNKILKLLRYFIYILGIYLLYSLEQTPAFWFGFNGIKPMLVIIGFVCVSLFEKEWFNILLGFLSGLLVDFYFGCTLGLNALILCAVGAILGGLFSHKLSVTVLNAVVISVVISVLEMSLNLYLRYRIYGLANIWPLWETSFLWYVILTVVLSVPIYLFSRSVSYLTRERQDEYYKY